MIAYLHLYVTTALASREKERRSLKFKIDHPAIWLSSYNVKTFYCANGIDSKQFDEFDLYWAFIEVRSSLGRVNAPLKEITTAVWLRKRGGGQLTLRAGALLPRKCTRIAASDKNDFCPFVVFVSNTNGKLLIPDEEHLKKGKDISLQFWAV